MAFKDILVCAHVVGIMLLMATVEHFEVDGMLLKLFPLL
jgi:hypothetical protein